MQVFKDMDLPLLFLWMTHYGGGSKIYPTSLVFCPSPSPFLTTHNICNATESVTYHFTIYPSHQLFPLKRLVVLK